MHRIESKLFCSLAAVALGVAMLTPDLAVADFAIAINATTGPAGNVLPNPDLGSVTVGGDGNQVTMTVAMAPGLGLDRFGFNYSGDPGNISSISGTGTGPQGPNGWALSSSSFQFGPFGRAGYALNSAHTDTSAVFTITGHNLNPADFLNSLTTGGPGQTPVIVAMHMNQLNSNGGGNHFGGAELAPVPPTWIIGLLGVASLGVLRLRRRLL